MTEPNLTTRQQEDLFAAILFDTDQDECGEYAETEAVVARMIAAAEETARAEGYRRGADEAFTAAGVVPYRSTP